MEATKKGIRKHSFFVATQKRAFDLVEVTGFERVKEKNQRPKTAHFRGLKH